MDTKIANPFLQNKLNRFFGGTNAQTDPYVSGFFLIQFKKLPAFMEEQEGSVLTALSTTITLPDYNMERVTANALGGLKYHVPGALTIGEGFTVNFTEFQQLPVFYTIRKWHHAIRNNILGFANDPKLVKGTGEYVQKSYKASVIVVYLRPDMKDIEFYCKMTGVWPVKVPTSELNSEIATVEKKDLSVEFSVDLIFFDDWVKEEAQGFVDAIRSDTTINYLLNSDKGDGSGASKPSFGPAT